MWRCVRARVSLPVLVRVPVGFPSSSSSAVSCASVVLRRTMSASPNPLLNEWTTGFPPFSQIKASHFKPALEVAFQEHLKELKEIVDNAEEATFENTIAAFDRAGLKKSRVAGIFDNLCSSCCTPDLQNVEAEMAGPIEAHKNATYMLPGLFDRIDKVHASRHAAVSLSKEQLLLTERVHLDFVRHGAKFSEAMKVEYSQVTEELARLQIQFSQNVLADESTYTLDLKSDDLTGLPDYVVSAAKQAAVERNKPEDVYCITLSRSLVVPFLTYSDRNDLRQTAWTAWTKRGELEEVRDNRKIITDILRLRARQANMHGYNSFADYATADTMAGSPTAVMELLERVWVPAKVRADSERTTMESEFGVDIAPWDWRYYAEKVRCSKFDLDENELKPYLSLDCMVTAIFDCANKLFGLRFVPRSDIEVYHPDVKVYEVFETITSSEGQVEDRTVGIFMHDNFARPHKKSGAWMSEFWSQSRNIDTVGTHRCPLVVNNNNFNKGTADEPTLLSFDDCVTLFHEFGHGLHGLLSNVSYNALASTNVLLDWVELPSQLYEHWLSQPEVLKAYARHYRTGESIPDDLIRRLKAARTFNQGFATVEYTASAFVDQLLHKVPLDELKTFDVASFEDKELKRLEMPSGIVMRHRPAHFSHLFSSSYYAAGYYVYLWAEVLDADGFEAFKETGNCFDEETARRVRQYIYSSGSSIEHREAYRAFRGRDPSVESMLKKKGLII